MDMINHNPPPISKIGNRLPKLEVLSNDPAAALVADPNNNCSPLGKVIALPPCEMASTLARVCPLEFTICAHWYPAGAGGVALLGDTEFGPLYPGIPPLGTPYPAGSTGYGLSIATAATEEQATELPPES